MPGCIDYCVYRVPFQFPGSARWLQMARFRFETSGVPKNGHVRSPLHSSRVGECRIGESVLLLFWVSLSVKSHEMDTSITHPSISPSSAPRARQPASANPKVFGSHSVATNERDRKTVGPPKQVPTTDVFFHTIHALLGGRARRRETILRSSIELINRWQHEAAVQSQGRRPTRREAAQGGRAQPALSARSHFFQFKDTTEGRRLRRQLLVGPCARIRARLCLLWVLISVSVRPAVFVTF